MEEKHPTTTAWTVTPASLGPPRVHRIVITGGPCAGKTTAMAKLQLRLTDMGFAVYVVPELATLTITGGASPGTYSRAEFVAWETALLRGQMDLEDRFAEIANHCSADKHSVLLCDRGTMDVLAYVGQDAFLEILEENAWTVPQLRDKRYNAVIHLVTAAIGAEDFYTLENNKARMETPDEARSLDGRLSRAWIGHNSLRIIENSGSFEEKMVRVQQAVCESLGVPGPRATPRWWIVEIDFGNWPDSLEYAEWQLEHVFLKKTNGNESRVTKKSQPQSTTYHLRVAGAVVNGEQSISERVLSFREYKALLVQADLERSPIRKTRRAFIWHNEYYLIDSFQSPPQTAGVTTLFIEAPISESTKRELPPFVNLKEDVTQRKWFTTLAHDSWKRTMAMADEISSTKPPPSPKRP
ncbi:hypothetical protein CTAYLR_003756 [Chrysophaeum taylorii]|uniref:NadR/Ttd14 AAA domain-containing protein n=1 Tax=Chrysophaeum taylorii TaxID=2483200 RepID=A0AAD7UCY9_9STRA|nr:hypothetical protein CTAYLR_003756 [Chrysophaeum taylorii]